MCTLVDSKYCVIRQKGVTCGPCNPYGVAIPVISLKVTQASFHYDSRNHLTWIPPHGRSLPLHLISDRIKMQYHHIHASAGKEM